MGEGKNKGLASDNKYRIIRVRVRLISNKGLASVSGSGSGSASASTSGSGSGSGSGSRQLCVFGWKRCDDSFSCFVRLEVVREARGHTYM